MDTYKITTEEQGHSPKNKNAGAIYRAVSGSNK
jgi:hypothetical protein